APDFEGLLEALAAHVQGIQLLAEFSARSADALAAFGEQLAVRIVEALLVGRGLRVVRVDARDWVATDGGYGAALVERERTRAAIAQGVAAAGTGWDILLTEGFIGRAPDGSTTTLGRGGSDYTASLIASAVGARCMEKSTDVPGMMSADPRLVYNARMIPSMSYEEALELCHFGAKVIYHPTIEPLREAGVPLIVRSTFDSDAPGTRITAQPTDAAVVRGLSSVSDIALLTLSGGQIIARPGFSRRVFTALGLAGVNVVLITQSSSEQSLTLAVAGAELGRARAALDGEFEAELALGRLEPLRIDAGLAIVALVGGGMQSTAGVSGQAFGALGRAQINVRAIAQGSTERNISIVVAERDVPAALRALHAAFFEPPVRRLHVCLVGLGQVGRALEGQIRSTAPHLLAQGIEIRVVGWATSREAWVAEPGAGEAGPSGMTGAGGAGGTAAPGGTAGGTAGAGGTAAPARRVEGTEALLAWFAGVGLEGSVWVDNSASAEVAATYLTALQAGIHVVCSNKIAAAGPWAEVQRCRDAARARGVRWLNEANVGAGLPVLDTLRNLVATGDRVLRIEAAVSGSLGYIFDRFDAEGDFVAAVRAAAERGFTEPDPRIDLSGMDVARKILILAREAGAPLEGPEVERTPFLPEELFSGGVADFWAGLPAAAPALAAQRAAAHARGEKLRYVATFAEGRCTVGLRSLPPGHPLGACAGTDNWIAFYTERYPERPLIVQGSGAGAEVTAAGVLGDLLRLVGGAHGPVR
ncbi:MAG: hypothetical protein RLZ32_3100, partial [Gemmatimonadota bacterium]